LSPPAAALKVLLVEDEAIAALALTHMLEDLGCEVVGVADSGARCLELARAARPDLLIMDVRLRGEMDGLQAATELRKWLAAPIVFTSAYSQEELVRRGAPERDVAFIGKPIALADLRQVLERFAGPARRP
jgi:CheY-like chemotaxis protein